MPPWILNIDRFVGTLRSIILESNRVFCFTQSLFYLDYSSSAADDDEASYFYYPDYGAAAGKSYSPLVSYYWLATL